MNKYLNKINRNTALGKFLSRQKLVLFALLTSLISATAKDNADAKQLFENSAQKLSIKNVHLVLDMETSDGKGNRKTKTLGVSFAEFDQAKKTLIEFLAPENVKGTKILTNDYKNKKGIIEIYMPATGKVQKIRANQRNMRILGSEIPIDQFRAVVEDGLNYTLTGEEKINGINCYRIKMQKTDEKGYEVAFISVEKEQLLKIEQYDNQNRMTGMTELSDYMEVNNSEHKFYPKKICVKNLKNKKISVMEIKQVNFLKNADIRDFQLSPTAS